MSVQNVRAEIEHFLTDGKPQVLCIRGAWGTGKTYTWDNVLERLAQATDKKLPFERYAKVSLFGLNSIVEIKREIFQATKPAAKIGKEFDPADLKDLYGAGKSSNLVFKALGLTVADVRRHNGVQSSRIRQREFYDQCGHPRHVV